MTVNVMIHVEGERDYIAFIAEPYMEVRTHGKDDLLTLVNLFCARHGLEPDFSNYNDQLAQVRFERALKLMDKGADDEQA